MTLQLNPDERRRIELTAYALGEVDQAKQRELDDLLEHDADARAYVQEIRDTASTVTNALAHEPLPALQPQQRHRLAAARFNPWPRRFALAAGLILTGGLSTLLIGPALHAPPAPMPHPAVMSHDQAPVMAHEQPAPPLAKDDSPLRSPPAASTTVARPMQALAERDGEPLALFPAGAPPAPAAMMRQEAAQGVRSRKIMGLAGMHDRHTAPVPETGHDEDMLRGQRAPLHTEGYAHTPDNPFHRVADAPLSTFSIDVDTASYANVRRMIANGQLPPPDAVRIEEFINSFSYAYAPPEEAETPLAVHVEVGPAPWRPQHRLVRIGLKGYEVPAQDRPRANLVFLLDISGSMQPPNKLPLLKQAMRKLTAALRPDDRVAIVVYAGAAGLVLDSTTDHDAVIDALDQLEAGGSTNGGQGIELAYRVALQHHLPGGINRVILATDGDFNVGTTDQGSLVRLIEEQAKSGTYLTILGLGMGNLKDDTLELLSNKGEGNYAYLDTLDEAHRVLVEQIGSTLHTIAKDVKIQVEFNPAHAAAYRLIGYENRVLADRDFNDDVKDAGDLGSGHTVTALYEVVPPGVELPLPGVDPLRYQAAAKPQAVPDDRGGELLTVKLRYKAPDAEKVQGTSRVMEVPVVDAGQTLEQTSDDFRFAAAAAGFGMLLRESEHKGEATWPNIADLAGGAMGDDPQGQRAAMIDLIRTASQLAPGQ